MLLHFFQFLSSFFFLNSLAHLRMIHFELKGKPINFLQVPHTHFSFNHFLRYFNEGTLKVL